MKFIRELITSAQHCLPFMVAASQSEGIKMQLNRPRVVEGVLIAVVAAGVIAVVSWLFLIPKIIHSVEAMEERMNMKFDYIQRDVSAVAEKMESLDDDVNILKTDVAIERMRHDQ